MCYVHVHSTSGLKNFLKLILKQKQIATVKEVWIPGPN